MTVRLYKESKRMGAPRVPVFVRVPKRVPKLAMGGEILSSGALWMQLIERACAQVGMFREGRFGYQSLWYGKGDEWLSILTGASGQSVFEDGIYTGPKFDAGGKVIYTEKEVTDALTQEKKIVKEPVPGDIENLFETMTIAKSSKLIFHAGTKDNAAPGMNSGHAYTVLGTKTVGHSFQSPCKSQNQTGRNHSLKSVWNAEHTSLERKNLAANIEYDCDNQGSKRTEYKTNRSI